jgi:hypothetical protein
MKHIWDVTFEKPSYDIPIMKGLLCGVSHEVGFPENADVKPPRGIFDAPWRSFRIFAP